MALDNLHCPQFVDFTNPRFDTMDDGADKYFENGIVGEQFDMGFGFDDDPWKKDNDQKPHLEPKKQAADQQPQQKSKKDSGISLNQSPTSGDVVAPQPAKLTKTASIKQPIQTKTSVYRQRTNSTCSTSSRTTQNTSITNKSTTIKSNNQNIVKKTLAKVTAAFKPVVTINPKQNDNQFKICSSVASGAHKKKQMAKQHGPMRVNHNLNASQASGKSTNRRCSSVPRTINLTVANQHPQLPKTQITLGEKIQNFFSRDKTSTNGNGSTAHSKTSGVGNQAADLRRRSKSNENKPSIDHPTMHASASNRSRLPTAEAISTETLSNKLKKQSQNKSMMTTNQVQKSSASQQPLRLTEPKSPNFTWKPRQKSCDRKEAASPMPYQGLKFLPNLVNNANKPNKNQVLEPIINIDEKLKQAYNKEEKMKKLQDTEINKVNPLVLPENKQILKAPSRLNGSLSKHNKENSQNTTDALLETAAAKRVNESLNIKAMNLSTMSTASSSKRSTNEQKPMFLRTEERAQKRQQYDDYLKEKERMADAIRKNIEMQKMFQEKNEIKIIRENQQFKSRPFKLGKPMIIKPSEKPLTEAKSPLIFKTSSSSICQSQTRPFSGSTQNLNNSSDN